MYQDGKLLDLTELFVGLVGQGMKFEQGVLSSRQDFGIEA